MEPNKQTRKTRLIIEIETKVGFWNHENDNKPGFWAVDFVEEHIEAEELLCLHSTCTGIL